MTETHSIKQAASSCSAWPRSLLAALDPRMQTGAPGAQTSFILDRDALIPVRDRLSDECGCGVIPLKVLRP